MLSWGSAGAFCMNWLSLKPVLTCSGSQKSESDTMEEKTLLAHTNAPLRNPLSSPLS